MSNTRIEHIYKYEISPAEIASLPADQAACLGVLSFAASESNVLRRSYLHASHDIIGDMTLDTGLFVQRFIFLRLISAKLFEVQDFLSFGGRKKTTEDAIILRLAEDALSDFESIKNTDGYRLARKMRHEATAHYSFAAAKKNLRHLPIKANCNMYLHNKGGNSFYPFGEELMFMAGVTAYAGGGKSTQDLLELFDLWFNWTTQAGSWLDRVNYKFHRELVLDVFPKKVARQEVKWLSKDMAASHEEMKIPLFLRSEDQDNK